jgi:hypothetical protein
MQKRSRRRHSTPNPALRNKLLSRRNIPEQDLWLFARSSHAAAKNLAEAADLHSGPFTPLAACPVVFMYRHALELYLKAIVLAEGGNFLKTRPDRISIGKTHSVSWLAQFVCQIVTALGWQEEFKCQGIENLDDFKAIIESVNEVDPGQYVFRFPGEPEAQASFNVRKFARRMDALLELLDSTADALAAE